MVYIFAIIGFFMGFGVGLGTINVLLRHRSKKDIQDDKSLRWTYGILVWFFAGVGCWLGVLIYNSYF
jgi:hypothetical protein